MDIRETGVLIQVILEALTEKRKAVELGNKYFRKINPRGSLEEIRQKARQGRIEESSLEKPMRYRKDHYIRARDNGCVFSRTVTLKDLPPTQEHDPKTTDCTSNMEVTVSSWEVRRNEHENGFETLVVVQGGFIFDGTHPRYQTVLDPSDPDFASKYQDALSDAWSKRYIPYKKISDYDLNHPSFFRGKTLSDIRPGLSPQDRQELYNWLRSRR